MKKCDFCKEEIPAMHAGRQLGRLFMHQECYNFIVNNLESTLEKIELEAGEVGPLGEIIQPILPIDQD